MDDLVKDAENAVEGASDESDWEGRWMCLDLMFCLLCYFSFQVKGFIQGSLETNFAVDLIKDFFVIFVVINKFYDNLP